MWLTHNSKARTFNVEQRLPTQAGYNTQPVAEGVQFQDGTVVVRKLGQSGTLHYGSMKEALKVWPCQFWWADTRPGDTVEVLADGCYLGWWVVDAWGDHTSWFWCIGQENGVTKRLSFCEAELRSLVPGQEMGP